MPPQQMFRLREQDQTNVAKTWNMSFHVALIFVIFLLKDNQTTVIFGIRKQKKNVARKDVVSIWNEKNWINMWNVHQSSQNLAGYQ